MSNLTLPPQSILLPSPEEVAAAECFSNRYAVWEAINDRRRNWFDSWESAYSRHRDRPALTDQLRRVLWAAMQYESNIWLFSFEPLLLSSPADFASLQSNGGYLLRSIVKNPITVVRPHITHNRGQAFRLLPITVAYPHLRLQEEIQWWELTNRFRFLADPRRLRDEEADLIDRCVIFWGEEKPGGPTAASAVKWLRDKLWEAMNEAALHHGAAEVPPRPDIPSESVSGDDVSRVFDPIPNWLRRSMRAGVDSVPVHLTRPAQIETPLTREASPPQPSSVLHHDEKSYSFRGRHVCMGFSAHNVLQAFLKTKRAMTTEELENVVSNVTEAVDYIESRLGRGAVQRPKNRNDGYFIEVQPAPKPE